MGKGKGLRGRGECDDKVGPRVHLGQRQQNEGRVLMSLKGLTQCPERGEEAWSLLLAVYCRVFGVSEQPEEREGSSLWGSGGSIQRSWLRCSEDA